MRAALLLFPLIACTGGPEPTTAERLEGAWRVLHSASQEAEARKKKVALDSRATKREMTEAGLTSFEIAMAETLRNIMASEDSSEEILKAQRSTLLALPDLTLRVEPATLQLQSDDHRLELAWQIAPGAPATESTLSVITRDPRGDGVTESVSISLLDGSLQWDEAVLSEPLRFEVYQ